MDHVDSILELPRVIGAGLVALDVVMHNESPDRSNLYAGGTCGNVMAILSYLGWSAYPVARMNGDKASEAVRQDLKRWGVRLDFMGLLPSGEAPVIVQRIKRDVNGRAVHSFSWQCPRCGSDLPRYLPVHAGAARSLTEQIGHADVFFADRVSRSSLVLARSCVEQGALVVFEPSSIGDIDQFREMVALAQVVKFSRDRLKQLPSLLEEIALEKCPRLEIETLGDQGLRYRRRSMENSESPWHTLGAFSMDKVRDTCGAGDWTTAGIIAKIGIQGSSGFCVATDAQIHDALAFGQALAAWNCGFYGARGGMYYSSREDLERFISGILLGCSYELPATNCLDMTMDYAASVFCANCGKASASSTSDAFIV